MNRMPQSAEEIPEFRGTCSFRIPHSDGTTRRFGHAEGDGQRLLDLSDRVGAVGIVFRDFDNRSCQEFSRPNLDGAWEPVA